MNYTIKNTDTDKILFTGEPEECDQYILTMKLEIGSYYVVKNHACRGCQKYKDDTQERSDWYGISTGYYCEDCYENNYPYRKDRYPTQEFDGYGEQLEEEY